MGEAGWFLPSTAFFFLGIMLSVTTLHLPIAERQDGLGGWRWWGWGLVEKMGTLRFFTDVPSHAARQKLQTMTRWVHVHHVSVGESPDATA